MIEVQLKKVEVNARIPKRMTEHSAGYDLYSSNSEDIFLESGEVKLISTGIAISLPAGYEAQIRPRSGLAVKHQIGILNAPGTIDTDYRGEVKVILFNFGKKDFIIKPQTRIAQMVIAKHEKVNFIEIEGLDETGRGSGGFGHTSY
ncbi:MAG: dUTP diphosphatase [Armatimonadetes bacterium]|nr:dUTP diphosphatase [Armatimonadota bacterium]